jgi:GNAT superfamily N-acetyltransferase/catechol 2,3-dioxygenase-like lactoylglutathione lyase family enzyme
MRLRMELFVEDLDVSVAFYHDVLGFRVERRTADYVSLVRGLVVLGLGPIAKLPETGDGPGFTRRRLAGDKGAGVEIVLEVDGPDELRALYDHCRRRAAVAEPIQLRSWGLHDFRLTDPDGYYLRVTHGNAALPVTGRPAKDGVESRGVVLVRPATTDDAAALGVVHVRSWQVAYRGQVPQEHLDRLDPRQRRLGWLRWLQDNPPPAAVLVAQDGSGEVVGFVNVAPSRDEDTDPRLVGEVQAVYVLPEHWGQGTGRLLMEAALRRLRVYGYREVTLWVLASNERARRFYEAGGWRPDGATKTDASRGFPLTEVRYRRTDA